MRFRVWVVLLLFVSSCAFAQTDSIKVRCKSVEDSLIYYFTQQRRATSDKDRIALNLIICKQFYTLFDISGSFSYALDSLKTCGHLYSPDKVFRLITWNVEMNDGTHVHYGFVQLSSNRRGKSFFELKDLSGRITNPEQSVLSAGKWYGGLYYKILRNKVDARVYYTVLGLQYHNLFTTRKFIDVMYFDEYGNPVFGAPIFQFGVKQTKLRVIFEYSAMLTMSLRYDDLQKQIVFDHLSPSEPRYEGVYQYYGPDMSFDGLMFDKNRWVYISKIETRKPDSVKVKSTKNAPIR